MYELSRTWYLEELTDEHIDEFDTLEEAENLMDETINGEIDLWAMEGVKLEEAESDDKLYRLLEQGEHPWLECRITKVKAE